MKNIFLLFFTTATFVSCEKEIKADKEFIKEVAEYYAEHTSMSADVAYKVKYFDNDDTTKINTSVKLIRDTKDTIYGGIVWYKSHIDSIYKNIEKYYDENKLYLIKNDSLSILRYDAKKGETFIIDGASDGDVMNIHFLKPEKLAEVLNDSLIKNTIKDTVFNNKEYALLSLQYPDEDDFTGRLKKVFINKDSKTIEKITYYCQYHDQYQYNEWNITNIKFNSVKKEELDRHLKKLTSKYKVTTYKPLTKEEMAPLAIGTEAPEFKGKFYNDNAQISLSDYKGKIVILDFWYMSCYPCTVAVPHLNEIQEKYKDKVVVLGVNPVDTDEKAVNKIPDFIKRTGLIYSIATINQQTVKDYNIYGFPTLYIIDKNGVIQYAEPGFNENLQQTLKEEINKLL